MLGLHLMEPNLYQWTKAVTVKKVDFSVGPGGDDLDEDEDDDDRDGLDGGLGDAVKRVDPSVELASIPARRNLKWIKEF